ncbi:MAG: carboxypeptidase-like regulatory domain-containing protein [Candidatus Electryonea clarkiae]|nr:carboxypeptidase-like regulatory domain-containing protein [Candidatus Electryonea clarkiae]MDP8286022.1 carboxypeptidase-like regulatory domain-containing protein [Candidatus Electryonea clarkiae]
MFSKSNTILFILLCNFVSIFVFSTAIAFPYAYITGTISDYSNQKPVHNAKIELYRINAQIHVNDRRNEIRFSRRPFSNSKGDYHIFGIPPGRYRLVIIHPNYAPFEREIAVIPPEELLHKTTLYPLIFDNNLFPAPGMKHIVSDRISEETLFIAGHALEAETGKQLPYGQVIPTALQIPDSIHVFENIFGINQAKYPDSQGAFFLQLPPGEYSMNAIARYYPGIKRKVMAKPIYEWIDPDAWIQFELISESNLRNLKINTVTGKVTDENSIPLSNVEVKQKPGKLSTTTDVFGRYYFEDMASHTGWLTFTKDLYHIEKIKYSIPLPVEKIPQETIQNITLISTNKIGPYVYIRGVVIDSLTGELVPMATMEATLNPIAKRYQRGNKFTLLTRSDHEGRFIFMGLPAESFTISIITGGYKISDNTISIDQEDNSGLDLIPIRQDFYLEKVSNVVVHPNKRIKSIYDEEWIIGIVLDRQSGAPLPNVKVVEENDRQNYMITDNSGFFHFHLQRGTHKLILNRRGYQRENKTVSTGPLSAYLKKENWHHLKMNK